MTLVTIDIKNEGYETSPDDRVVFYSPANRNEQGTIISTAETSVALVDGQAEKDLAPGPVVVRILAQGVADTREKSGYVPETVEGADPISLWDVIVDWTPALVDQGILAILTALDVALPAIESARDDALSQVEGSVEDALADYFQESTNVFDSGAATEGFSIPDGGVGEPIVNPTHSISARIPVKSGQVYTSFRFLRASFFDDDSFVTSVGLSATEVRTWSVPENVTHVRFTLHTSYLTSAQLNKGGVLLPYEPGYPGRVSADRIDLSGVQPRGDYITAPVTAEQTEFFTTSTNLLDDRDALKGFVLPSGSGTPVEEAPYMVTRHIAVQGGQPYTVANALRLSFFTGDKVFISSFNASTTEARTTTAPVDAAYVRVTLVTVEINKTAQLNAGDTLLPFEAAHPGYIALSKLDPLLSAASNTPTSPAETTFFDKPANLVDLGNALTGFSIPSGSASPTPTVGYMATAIIPTSPGQEYRASRVYRMTWLDAEGEYVNYDTLNNNEDVAVTAPAGAFFLRMSLSNVHLGAAQLNEGTTLAAYTPGTPKIFPGYIPDRVTTVDTGAMPLIQDVPGLDEVYEGPPIADQVALRDTTAADIYQMWDDLLDAHPSYVSKRLMGTSSDGVTPMYVYTLKPSEVPNTPDGSVSEVRKSPLPVAILMAGIHTYEHSGVHHLWRFAKALCDEWETSRVLDAMRWNFEFVCIPLASPATWLPDGGRRHNANGVDLARNFPASWTDTQPNPGEFPLSEAETQYIDALMREFSSRAIFGVSLHNYANSEANSWSMIWQAAPNEMMMRLGKQVVSRMSRRWNMKHDWITNRHEYYGYSNLAAPPGSEGRAFAAYGIPGSTFETSTVHRLSIDDAGVHRSAIAMTLGYESTVNYIAMGLAAGLRLKQMKS